jgi:predicted nucleic acid-binding Zn ribbon protein
MSFEPFQKFLKRAANHYGINKEMEAAKVCHNFRELVPDIFAAKHFVSPEENITPASFKGDTLTVNVASAAWAQEIMTRKHSIIRQMNTKLGKEIVSELRTKLSA